MIQRRLHVQRIAQRLAEMNLTLDDFKAAVGLDRRTIERLLSGQSQNARPQTVHVIAQFLGLAPRDILFLPHADGVPPLAAPSHMPAVELRLPVTGAQLVGRTAELARLDHLWAGGQVNVLSIMAWGGVGKSGLVNGWIGQLARDGWRGAERVFGWTFSSQGMGETVASADEFLEAALRFFGDPDPSVGTPWDKGQRLARGIQAQRTLLILDGLEPLQHPPGPEAGKVQDPALATLLQALALHNPGFCIITTRLAVADLAAWHATTIAVLPLDALAEEAGAELLHTLGVTGSEAARRAASREYTGHPLALQLLGTYLRDVCGGDVRRRREITLLDDWSEPGSPAWHVMASYERWFGQGPEVAVLRMLGLFDRVAHADEVAALRAEPRIPAVNEALIGLSERQWVHTLRRLRTTGLLAPPDPHTPDALDTHPLIRAYYRHQLREQYPAAWRAGHARLATYLQESVVEECPATIEELMPLYAVVAHSCLAGCEHDALRVFRLRIRRGDEHFSVEQLGAFGLDLATLAHFFVQLWSTVAPSMPVDDACFLLQATGECLSALGRVDEAIAPLQHARTLAHHNDDWTSAALAATKLSEVYRARGELATAVRWADQGAAYGRRPGVPPHVHVLSHAFLGFALYWVGQSTEALTTLQEAEQVQQRAHPARPHLYGLLGYMYSELLLDDLESHADTLLPAQFAPAWWALQARIAHALRWAQQDKLPSDTGLQHVAMARAYVLAWQHPGAAADADGLPPRVEPSAERPATLPDPATAQQEAAAHVARAVEALRLSNHRNYFPRALLARATLSRLQGQFTRAHQDVEAVLDMAQHSAMDFYRADAYL